MTCALRWVDLRLRETVTEAQLVECFDLEVGRLQEVDERMARQVRGRRRCPGDVRYFHDAAMQETVRLSGCPFGCKVKGWIAAQSLMTCHGYARLP